MDGPDRNDCPDEMTTAAYLDRTLTPARREALESHFADCDPCRAGVTLLATMDAKDSRAPAAFVARARSRRVVSGWALAAAALVVTGAALGIVWSRRVEPPSEFRGSPENVFGTVTPPSGAVVALDDLAFGWQAVPGADRYDLEVSSAAGETLLSLRLGAGVTSARWPSDRPRPARGALIWRLRARALDRVVAEMRPVPFEVR